MSKRQTGQTFKLGDGSWAYRYRRSDGKRPQKGGYTTKGAARHALDVQLEMDRGGYRPAITFDELCDVFLEQHQAKKRTTDRLRWSLSKSRERFGSLDVDRIHPADVQEWRSRLPESQRHHCHAELRQALNAAVRWRYLRENPAALIPNPRPDRAEVIHFDRAEVTAIMRELEGETANNDPAFVLLLADAGLRPGEAVALERRDIDLTNRVIYVRRSYSKGVLSILPKNGGRRSVPIRERLAQALSGLPRRIDVRLYFPAKGGGYRNMDNWRRRQWADALGCLDGVSYRQPYALRHTYATENIAAGVPLFLLAYRMGTSISQISQTYGHLAKGSDTFELGLLNAYDRATDDAQEKQDAADR